jgi:hypothetical protein
MTNKKKVIKRRTEFSNIEVRRFLNRFFCVPRVDKLQLADIIPAVDGEHVVYSSKFEIDSKGYITEYRLLTETLRHIGIRIGENAWVCTSRKHNSSDVRFIADVTAPTPEETPPVQVDERQLNLLS